MRQAARWLILSKECKKILRLKFFFQLKYKNIFLWFKKIFWMGISFVGCMKLVLDRLLKKLCCNKKVLNDVATWLYLKFPSTSYCCKNAWKLQRMDLFWKAKITSSHKCKFQGLKIEFKTLFCSPRQAFTKYLRLIHKIE